MCIRPRGPVVVGHRPVAVGVEAIGPVAQREQRARWDGIRSLITVLGLIHKNMS